MRVTDEQLATLTNLSKSPALHPHEVEAFRAALAALSHAAGQEAVAFDRETVFRRAELIAASLVLIAKMDEVHADPKYMAVWSIAQSHIGPYTGPQYDVELNRLRAAVKFPPDTPAQPPASAEVVAKYHELIYAVAQKWPEETRHQTALRYIMERESTVTSEAASSGRKGENGNG